MVDALRCVVVALLLGACATASRSQPPPASPPAQEPTPAPPPAAATAPEAAPPAPLGANFTESHRIAGSSAILLPDPVLVRLVSKGLTAVHPKIMLCLDEDGVPRSIDFTESTSDAEGDDWIRSHMSEWRYSPFVIDGRVRPVCFMVHLNYRLRAPEPRAP